MLDQAVRAERPARSVVSEAKSLPELFLRRARATPGASAWQRKTDGVWKTTSYREFFDDAARVASWLIDRGLGVGDKLCVVGGTRPEWCISDMGGVLAGAVTVGAYPTLAPAQLAYVIDHSDSTFVFVEGKADLEKLLGIRADVPKLRTVVLWDTEGCEKLLAAHDFVVPLAKLLESAADEKRIETRIAEVDPEESAIIVYTSGTTGPPKGAMISHRNILTLLGAPTVIEYDADDFGLSFLPMAHVAERVLGFYGRVAWGTSTAYATSIPAVLEEVKEVRPTFFGSVPRIFEKAYASIQGMVDKAPPGRQRVFRWAEKVGLDVVHRWQAKQQIPRVLTLKYRVADRLVFSKLREIFGGRVKYYVTGAAPIPRKVIEFFWAAGFPIYEVYGMTEATVLTHMNKPGQVRVGSVGKALPFVEEKLAEDGEILLRGPTVFKGYYKEPAATREAVDEEGWLHTGDVGKRDADGFLYIVDRKKHIIITAGGKNLTPANIENEIKAQDPMISQVHAHGDTRSYVTAIVTIHPVEAIDWAKQHGLSDDAAALDAMRLELLQNPLARPPGLHAMMQKVTADAKLRERIVAAARRGNEKLSRVEQVKRFHLLDRDFSLEDDEITPTLKVKRKNIEKKFAATFDRLYEDEAFGIAV